MRPGLFCKPCAACTYEEHLAELEPVLEGVKLADLTDDDTAFLAPETGIPPEHIELVRQAARLERETEIPAEAFYGWGRHGIPLVLDQLLARPNDDFVQAFRISFEENTIPSRLGALVEQILRRLDQLRSERAFRDEQSRISHEVFGQLFKQDTTDPLVRYQVKVRSVVNSGRHNF